MSQQHQIVVVQLDVSQHEIVPLQTICGRVPTAELIEVLNSEWAKEQGWQPITPGRHYRRPVTEEVAMEMEIGGDQDVRLVRRTSRQVNQDRQSQTQHELTAQLEEQSVRDAYNLAFHEVLGRAYMLAVPRQAEALGYQVVSQEETIDQLQHTFDVEVKLRVPELY